MEQRQSHGPVLLGLTIVAALAVACGRSVEVEMRVVGISAYNGATYLDLEEVHRQGKAACPTSEPERFPVGSRAIVTFTRHGLFENIQCSTLRPASIPSRRQDRPLLETGPGSF